MDHEQKAAMRSALNMLGFSYVDRWPKNFRLSELSSFLLRNVPRAKLLSTEKNGSVIAGGAVVLPLNDIPECLRNAGKEPSIDKDEGTSLFTFLNSGYKGICLLTFLEF